MTTVLTRLREQIDNPPPFTFTGNERGVVMKKDDARALLALYEAAKELVEDMCGCSAGDEVFLTAAYDTVRESVQTITGGA